MSFYIFVVEQININCSYKSSTLRMNRHFYCWYLLQRLVQLQWMLLIAKEWYWACKLTKCVYNKFVVWFTTAGPGSLCMSGWQWWTHQSILPPLRQGIVAWMSFEVACFLPLLCVFFYIFPTILHIGNSTLFGFRILKYRC